MLNFSADIFFWAILQLCFNEMFEIIILVKRNVLGWQSIKKLIHLKYLILEIPYTFSSTFS